MLRRAANGNDVLHLQLAERSFTTLLTGANESTLDHLGDRDVELLHLIADGLSDREIGARVFLSPHTIKHRIERLRRHAEVKKRVQLAAWAARQGFVSYLVESELVAPFF
jgi:DNA-binding NarL/FixJ family response regulator